MIDYIYQLLPVLTDLQHTFASLYESNAITAYQYGYLLTVVGIATSVAVLFAFFLGFFFFYKIARSFTGWFSMR